MTENRLQTKVDRSLEDPGYKDSANDDAGHVVQDTPIEDDGWPRGLALLASHQCTRTLFDETFHIALPTARALPSISLRSGYGHRARPAIASALFAEAEARSFSARFCRVVAVFG